MGSCIGRNRALTVEQVPAKTFLAGGWTFADRMERRNDWRQADLIEDI